jgi:hypothetical protein
MPQKKRKHNEKNEEKEVNDVYEESSIEVNSKLDITSNTYGIKTRQSTKDSLPKSKK